MALCALLIHRANRSLAIGVAPVATIEVPIVAGFGAFDIAVSAYTLAGATIGGTSVTSAGVRIVTDFPDMGIRNTITTGLVRPTSSTAAVATGGIAIVAGFGELRIAIAAALERTIRTATVIPDYATVIARFSNMRVHNPVAASLVRPAICAATITTHAVPVVTRLGRNKDAIATYDIAVAAFPLTGPTVFDLT